MSWDFTAKMGVEHQTWGFTNQKWGISEAPLPLFFIHDDPDFVHGASQIWQRRFRKNFWDVRAEITRL